jgi:chloramphenicol-sensitive protein RarD
MSDGTGRERRIGLLYALGAFGIWGLVMPVYLKALTGVPVAEILAHRIVWATLVAVVLLAVLGRRRELRAVLLPRSVGLLFVSAALVTVNWVVYVIAVTTDHILAASLGYFLNPLVSIALGMLVLGERLRAPQIAACGIAGAGVLILVATSRGLPWIALGLALSFGCYGLVRKIVAVEALVGFTFEVAVLTPLAAGYLLWLAAAGHGSFAPATTAAFLLGVFAYGEPFGGAEALSFGCIWLALLIYCLDAVARAGALKAPGAASD